MVNQNVSLHSVCMHAKYSSKPHLTACVREPFSCKLRPRSNCCLFHSSSLDVFLCFVCSFPKWITPISLFSTSLHLPAPSKFDSYLYEAGFSALFQVCQSVQLLYKCWCLWAKKVKMIYSPTGSYFSMRTFRQVRIEFRTLKPESYNITSQYI